MTEEVKQKLRASGPKGQALLKVFDINQSGYAGCDRNGQIVDRREFPNAVPIQENRLLGIPKPKPLPNI